MRPVTDAADAELLHAADSEAAAFGELYRRHVLTVHGWFRRRLAWAAAVDGVVEKVLGKPARTMDAFLTEYANEFRA